MSKSMSKYISMQNVKSPLSPAELDVHLVPRPPAAPPLLRHGRRSPQRQARLLLLTHWLADDQKAPLCHWARQENRSDRSEGRLDGYVSEKVSLFIPFPFLSIIRVVQQVHKISHLLRVVYIRPIRSEATFFNRFPFWILELSHIHILHTNFICKELQDLIIA